MAQDIAKVANLINRIKTGASEPINPAYSKTADLISRIRAGSNAGKPSSGGTKYPIPSKSYFDPGMPGSSMDSSGKNLPAPTPLENGLNAIGYTFRVVMGLGRGITNAAYTTMEHANKAWDLGKDGFQPSDIAGYASQAAQVVPDFVWGAAKGLASSVIPEFGDMIKPIDSRPVIEAGYELFQTPEFKKSAQNIPALAAATDETKIGRINVPWDENIGFDVTPAGLYGFGWDVVTDPTSYVTLGLGGAVRGAGRGVAAVSKYAKAGKPAAMADVDPKALPRPYYGGKEAKATPSETVPYNVTNTSPSLYVLREMGRGFKEAHEQTMLRARARSARRAATGNLITRIAGRLTGKATPNGLENWEEELLLPVQDEIIAQAMADLQRVGITDPAKLLEEEQAVREVLREVSARIAADPAGLALITGKQAVAALEERAAKNGTTLVQESAQVLANRFATALPNRVPLIKKSKDTNIDVPAVEQLSRQIMDAADPNIEGGSFASAWDSFAENASPATLKRALQQLVMPLGFREKEFKKALEAAGEDPKSGNVIKAAFGLNISPKARGRKIDQDYEMVTERVAGKITRQKAVKKSTAEGAFLKGREKALFERYSGKPGSQNALLTGGPRKLIWNETEAEESGKRISDYLKSLGVTEDSQITGEMLEAAGVSPSLMASRLSYILNQENVASKDYNLITDLSRGEYNPATAEATHIKSNQFAFTDAERKAAGDRIGSTTLRQIVSKSLDASGSRVRNPRLYEILKKIGVDARDLDEMLEARRSESVPLNRIIEVLNNAKVQREAVARKKLANEILAKQYKARGVQISAEELMVEATRKLEQDKFDEVAIALATKVKSGALASDEELQEAVDIVSDVFAKQLEAREELTRMGFDINSPAEGLLYAVFTAVGRPAGKKTVTTEERALTALQAAIKNHPTVRPDERPISRELAFSGVLKSAEALLKAPNLPLVVRANAEKIVDYVKGLPAKDYSAIELRRVYARIYNYEKAITERMTFGDAGFNLSFRQRDGEIASNRIPDFVTRAYRASRAKDSLDNGYFADMIDSMLAKVERPALGTVALGQQKEVVAALKDTWRGEGVSVPLLLDVIRASTHKGTRSYKGQEATKAAKTFLAGVKDDATRFEKELRDQMVRNIIEDENSIEQLIKANETQFATMKTQQYGNMEAPFGETEAEIALVKGIVNKSRLVLDADTIDLIKEYMKLGGETRLLKFRREGKPVTEGIKAGDTLDHTEFSTLAYKYPQYAEAKAAAPDLKPFESHEWRVPSNEEVMRYEQLVLNNDQYKFLTRKGPDGEDLVFWGSEDYYNDEGVGEFVFKPVNKTPESLDLIDKLPMRHEIERFFEETAAKQAKADKTPQTRLNQVASQLYTKGLRQGYNKAARELAVMRANAVVDTIYPNYAKAAEVIRTSSEILRVNPTGFEQVSNNLRARNWLATILTKADRAVTQYDLANTVTQKLRGFQKNAEGLRKQREDFETLLNRLDAKLATAGVQRGTVAVDGLSLDEVLETGNPRAFLDYLRTKKVVNQADRDDWKLAMSHLANLTTVGKGSAYDNYDELLQSYKDNKTQLLAGEINPATGKPVPSAEQVLSLISIRRGDEYVFGQKVGQKAENALAGDAIPDRRTLLTWLRPIKPGEIGDELQQAQRNDFIAATQMVNGNEVRRMVETLEDPEVVSSQWQEHLNSEIARNEAEGLNEINVLAALAAGRSAHKYFIEAASYGYKGRDKLGRPFRADQPSGKRNVVKTNFDKETNYEGFKAVLQNISSMAENRQLALGDPARKIFVAKMMTRVLNMRDLYFYSRGIFPSTTVDLKAGEGTILGLFKENVTDAMRKEAGKAVFISEANVLDVLGVNMVGDLFSIGPVNSLPVTALLPSARFLVQAVDSLPDSRYFTEAELNIVVDTMFALMINHIKKVTSNVAGDKKITAFDVDPTATYDNIRKIISELIRPENATKLYDQHTINAAYATKLLKYESGQISKPVTEAWERMLDNPNASAGMKIEETLKATEQLRKLLGQEDIDDNIKLMAEMDARVIIASRLDPDSLILANEAEAMVSIAESGTKGAQASNQARIDAAIAREPLQGNLMAMKMLAAEDKGILNADTRYDVFNQHLVGQQEVNWALKFADGSLGRAFAAYGMEDVRGVYGPVERLRVEKTTQYEQTAIGLAKKWQELSPDRDVMAEAWNIIKDIPEDVLAKATQAREQLYGLLDRRIGGQQGMLDIDVAKALNDESELLTPFLNMDDELLNRAVIDLWKLASPVVGGGRYSLLLRTGLNPNYLNRTIRELGLGFQKGVIDEAGNYTKTRDAFGFPTGSKDINEVASAWREWDIQKPIDMLVSLHTALQQAGKVPEMAVTLNRMFGVPKTKYKTAAEARKDGLVELTPVTAPSMGKELVYFMQSSDYYYPIQIAQQLAPMSKFVTEIKHMQGNGMLEKGLIAMNPIQNFAKQQMTLFSLKNWFQNTVGGYWTNWYAGVTNPVAQSVRAAKMLQTRGINLDGIDVDLTQLDKELAKFYAEQAKLGRKVRADNDPRGDGLIVGVKGKYGKVSYAELGNLFDAFGGFPPVQQSRDAEIMGEMGTPLSFSKKKKLKGVTETYNKAGYKLGHWASTRDAWLRGQLWLDVLAKGNWKSLEEGAREAMKVVDRYHPQLQDLSAFNQRVTRQLVLFFTWRAKTLGWVLMDLLDNPKRIMIPLKAQYNLQQQDEDLRSKRFGDFTPQNMFLPSWLQGNLDPLMKNENGEVFKFTTSNPVTDLLGSTGWLSGIDFNTYEPIYDQVPRVFLDTIQKFAFSSEPLLISALIEWGQGTTMDGRQLGSGGFSILGDTPLLVEDSLKRLGLGQIHTMVASMFPDIMLKATWDGKSKEAVGEEGYLAIINWLTGLKIGQINTLDNVQRGYKELLDKISKLKGLG